MVKHVSKFPINHFQGNKNRQSFLKKHAFRRQDVGFIILCCDFPTLKTFQTLVLA